MPTKIHRPLVLMSINDGDDAIEIAKKWVVDNGYGFNTVSIKRVTFNDGDAVISVVYKLPWFAPLKFLFLDAGMEGKCVKWVLEKPIF